MMTIIMDVQFIKLYLFMKFRFIFDSFENLSLRVYLCSLLLAIVEIGTVQYVSFG